MSLEKPGNERLDLYEAFKKALKEGNDETFFDADDLIAIIDQAVDLNDEYVQIEAVMRGYRYFSDNEELAVRRGFLFYNLNLDRGIENTIHSSRGSSPLWSILQLRLSDGKLPEDDILRILNSVLQTPGELDDETVIQLVDCATAVGKFHWLKSNEKKLREKAGYLPSLLYELYIASTTTFGQYAYGLQLLEELTEIEPFTIDFWIALAQHHEKVMNYEEALSATDYALAIDPKNLAALALKATALIDLGKSDRAEELLRPLLGADFEDKLKAEEIDTGIIALYARALIELGRTAEGIDWLMKGFEFAKADTQLADLLLCARIPHAKDLIDLHYECLSAEEQSQWDARAMAFYRRNNFFEAATLFRVLFDRDLLPEEHTAFFITALYVDGQYAECRDIFLDMLTRRYERLTPEICVAGLLAQCRVDTKAAVKRSLKMLEEHFPLQLRTDWSIGSTLSAVGFSSFLGMLGSMLQKPGKINVDTLDIFQAPKPPEVSSQQF